MKESTIGFIIAEACILCLIGVNLFFNYQFETMDLHKESTGKYYNDLVKMKDNVIANSNLMNMLLGVVGIWFLSIFIVYNSVYYIKNNSQKG